MFSVSLYLECILWVSQWNLSPSDGHSISMAKILKYWKLPLHHFGFMHDLFLWRFHCARPWSNCYGLLCLRYFIALHPHNVVGFHVHLICINALYLLLQVICGLWIMISYEAHKWHCYESLAVLYFSLFHLYWVPSDGCRLCIFSPWNSIWSVGIFCEPDKEQSQTQRSRDTQLLSHWKHWSRDWLQCLPGMCVLDYSCQVDDELEGSSGNT